MVSAKETVRSFEVSPDINSTSFAERLRDFASLKDFEIWAVNLEDGISLIKEDNLGKGGDGIFFLQHSKRGWYRVRFVYDFPGKEKQTRYSAEISKMPDPKLPIIKLLELESDNLPKLTFLRRTIWDQTQPWHQPTIASENAEIELVGDDVLLAKFFELLVTTNS